ncbi:MAG: succinate dehydrogenase/fumarate reductase iron-sulfur subunit [Promethearchaeota archaeon]
MGAENKKLKVHLIIQRGDNESNTQLKEYIVEVEQGSVVLDAVHAVQAEKSPDLAVRWNCKAGKCGSCSAEVNGQPKLMCMTKLSAYDLKKPILIKPLQTFPLIKDLVTDVSWNYDVNRSIKPFQMAKVDRPLMLQQDVNRVQEFRKCIECFLCQNVCHVLRTHNKYEEYAGPRFFVRLANLEMHPLDTEDRIKDIKDIHGIGYCNITKCCTEVCPEQIKITDNAIIPLKERVADQYYDPIKMIWRKIFKRRKTLPLGLKIAKSEE